VGGLKRSACASRDSSDPQFARGNSMAHGLRDDQAAARKMIAPSGLRTCSARQCRARLVGSPRARSAAAPQAIGRSRVAALSGRQVRRRKMRGMIEPHRGKACPGIEYLTAEESARTIDSPSRSRRISAHRGDRDSGPVRLMSARSRRPRARSIRARSEQPGIRRSSEVLPDPLAPVTASAAPDEASKSRLEILPGRPART